MMKILPINPTTYEVTLLSGDKVEIGDREAVDFKPHLKLKRWGEECFIKVGLPTTGKKSPIVEGDKVKRVEPNLEAHFYPLEPRMVIAKDKDGNDVYFGQLYPTYDWKDDKGYENFGDWVEKAAKKAGR